MYSSILCRTHRAATSIVILVLICLSFIFPLRKTHTVCMCVEIALEAKYSTRPHFLDCTQHLVLTLHYLIIVAALLSEPAPPLRFVCMCSNIIRTITWMVWNIVSTTQPHVCVYCSKSCLSSTDLAWHPLPSLYIFGFHLTHCSCLYLVQNALMHSTPVLRNTHVCVKGPIGSSIIAYSLQ